MSGKGGPHGNDYAKRGTMWRDAIRKAVTQDKGALDTIARKIIAAAKEGDLAAIREIGDRLDGKAVQGLELGGPNGKPIPSKIEMVVVDPNEDRDSEGLPAPTETGKV